MPTQVTNFSPETHGFNFNNCFRTDVIWGPAHITTSGRCGGMSYSALDCFFYGRDIPKDEDEDEDGDGDGELPVEGSVLSTYIYERQMKSLEGTGDQWTDFLFNPFGSRSRELFNRGIKGGGELEKLKKEIDSGRPCNLCLVAPDPDPSKSHQVVAYGYKMGSSRASLEIYIYDPNYRKTECMLCPNVQAGIYDYKYKASRKIIRDNDRKPKKWLAYFADTDYVRRKPPSWVDKDDTNYSHRDFSGRVLDHKDFRSDRLIGANFSLSSIKRVDFSGADATAAAFVRAVIVNSNFSEAELAGANFMGADLRLAVFADAKAEKTIFQGASLGGSDFSRCNLEHAQMQGADANRCNFKGARLYRASLTGAVLNEAHLEDADFCRAALSSAKVGFVACGVGANFEGASLDKADLRGSNFLKSRFVSANMGYSILNKTVFKRADLSRAVMAFSDLRGADLCEAKLNFANLMHSDLRGAKFTGADFTGTMIGGANISGATGIPREVRRQVGG